MSRWLWIVLWASLLGACDDVPIGPDAGGLGFDASSGDRVDEDSTTAPVVDVCDVSEQVFASDCVRCHGQGANAPELTLEGAQSELVGVESTTYPGTTRVVAGDPAASLLYRKITGTQGADEGSTMPLGGNLGGSQVQLVHDWIVAGAPTTCTP